MKAFNVFDGDLDRERDQPGFSWRAAAVGEKLGATKLGASLYELDPGEKTFPYHYEYGCEEWLLVVAGKPTLRDPEGEHELRPGDVVVFPEGPEGAHQLRNGTDEPIRVLLFSTKGLPNSAVYPGQRQDRGLDRERRRSGAALPDRQRRRLLGRRRALDPPRTPTTPTGRRGGRQLRRCLAFVRAAVRMNAARCCDLRSDPVVGSSPPPAIPDSEYPR